MEEDILSTPPTFKLYPETAIYIATFLGGPLVAGYLFAENFKRLGQPNKVKMTWLIAVGAMVLLFAIGFSVPNITKVPAFLITLIDALLAKFLAEKFQGADIKRHIASGGPMFSIWRGLWIGLLGSVVTVGVLVLVLLATDPGLFQY